MIRTRGKAFVRKYLDPPRTAGKQPLTMVLLLLVGDAPSLTDEALHALTIVDSDGALTLVIHEVEETDRFKGENAAGILVRM